MSAATEGPRTEIGGEEELEGYWQSLRRRPGYLHRPGVGSDSDAGPFLFLWHAKQTRDEVQES